MGMMRSDLRSNQDYFVLGDLPCVPSASNLPEDLRLTDSTGSTFRFQHLTLGRWKRSSPMHRCRMEGVVAVQERSSMQRRGAKIEVMIPMCEWFISNHRSLRHVVRVS